ncbi:DNA helicase-2/ATP-dependent DNA helicase PcrA [Agromyces flavus]|uniref:DNA 3'-5' helicase n=1 Tax=Agromyces flavus TaxID=589382 RepID=A0A1H1NLZ0_9MICO|nr:ATP-dependent DNA helicase [Agromyces flavus]MCP2369067.1 DNA helicase-2/ATP-dependent DNA helicase PcrA [Agromyces flavus]GGI48545.1 ATP-dependent DNA helicase [Agromyces flavus]SDR99883.1 DNA helicase-2 / ATP-dependent DNA helicase PcrA [Agromyces flavus]
MTVSTRALAAVRIGADEIAHRLGLHAPTPEQRAVIEADPGGQSLVVAGAGSGKTETMANRVVWLLANGYVDVPEVLGLTFTRKAAGELAERVRERVGQLVAEGVAEVVLDPLESATVSTYNAFAGAIYREHALRIGREPDAAILGEAAAWQLARSIVAASADERLVELDASLDRVTGAVLGLSRALAENVTDSRDVRAFARQFLAMADLPIEAPRKRTPFDSFVSALGIVDALPPLLDLADAYAAAKQQRGLVEFSDQVALALQICTAHPEVLDEHRERFATVLLDEYQDTSVVQTRLLAALFAGHPVMAVGDPDQSIYGWRGASAANLARFSADFAPGSSAVAYDLSTSWRNPVVVLDAANTLIAPLDAGIPKAPLRPSPFAGPGRLDVHWHETIDDEATAVAGWFADRMRPGGPTGALLCRTFAHVDLFAAALRERGIPVHVLGVAGLLDQPVIADLVCALRVVHDPTAGSELLRLLGGARWSIGPADLAALGGLARWLAERDLATRRLADEVRQGIRGSIAPDESPSIVDALDFVLTAPDEHRALARFTTEGLARLRRAGAQLQSLRRRAGLGLVDFVTLVQQELLLDIEVAANPAQPLGPASLETFGDLVAGFADTAEHATLGAFLGWLTEAEQRDRLSPRQDDPEPGAVQVLSIHGAKGLEWDAVAIPRMVEGELPATPRSAKGWLAFGMLPDEFRGDRDEIPELAWRGAQSQAEFDEAVRAYAAENRERHADEERRLAYVGVTRARSELLLTGSWWATQKAPRGPSTFLRELVPIGLIDPAVLPALPEHDENPRAAEASRVTWPLDPLGARRPAVVRAADAVRQAASGPSGADIGPALADDLRMLLEERRRRAEGGVAPGVPTRVPASRFKDYVDDPGAVAAEIARPMPQRPYRATRIGTLFHAWVEQRSTGGAGAGGAVPVDGTSPDLDELDLAFDLPADELVDDPVESRLERLRATFAASEWADRRPIAVELELHLPLDEHVFVCKLDAVYEVDPASEAGGRGIRYQVVDWKTGAAPRDARELELRQTQLALYRLAYARWAGVPASAIDAVFYYVEDDRVLRPDVLYDEGAIRRAWATVASRAGADAAASTGGTAAPEVPDAVRSAVAGGS